jgi:hypothetical protein
MRRRARCLIEHSRPWGAQDLEKGVNRALVQAGPVANLQELELGFSVLETG